MINRKIFPIHRLGIIAVITGLLLCLPSFAQAGAGAKKAAQEKLANDSAEAGMLRQAYGILGTADHDYKGHRKAAMKQIEDAAKRFGVDLKGDGKAHEPQRTSDEALHAALGILSNITGAVRGEGLTRIEAAIKQLNTALAIK